MLVTLGLALSIRLVAGIGSGRRGEDGGHVVSRCEMRSSCWIRWYGGMRRLLCTCTWYNSFWCSIDGKKLA